MASISVQDSQPLTQCHPLQFLKDHEIKVARAILLGHLESLGEGYGEQKQVHFKNISLHDPPKALLLPHLDSEASGVPFEQRPYVPRCVDITWTIDRDRTVTESTISLDARSIISQTHTRAGQYGPNVSTTKKSSRRIQQLFRSSPASL